MPYYKFRSADGVVFEKHLTFAELDPFTATALQEGTTRAYDAECVGSLQTTDSMWPLESDAAGVCPTQISDAEKHASDHGVPTYFNRETGQAIFTDRRHRKKYCELIHLRDNNGGYGDP